MAKYVTYRSKKPEISPIALRVVSHQGKDLTVSPAFGPSDYKSNLVEMQKTYQHNSELGNFPRFSFRPALTQESISASAYEFESEAKPNIFDQRWLQAGRIVRTPEGVFTNTLESDHDTLKAMLDGVKKANGIYLIDNSVAFAPYESFEIGIQEAGKFAEGGLARALEHTEGPVAKNLAAISAKRFYPRGVNVLGFEKPTEPISRVVRLNSGRYPSDRRLSVYGFYWFDDGYAFGVFDSGEDFKS